MPNIKFAVMCIICFDTKIMEIGILNYRTKTDEEPPQTPTENSLINPISSTNDPVTIAANQDQDDLPTDDIIDANVMEGTIGINKTDTLLANIPPNDDDIDAEMESSPEIHLTDSMKELELVEPPPDTQMQEDTGGGDIVNKNFEYFSKHSLLELSRYSWGTRQQRYLNGCTWSPDGTCLLTSVNGDGMHVIELPSDLYNNDALAFDGRPLDILQSAVFVKNGGTVYDYCWYPFMDSRQPITCCWLSTQQHGPIQMWDAFDGKLRCSYRGFDAVDEVEAALSCTFSSDATDVIGGYRKSLKIFRTDVPGRDFINVPLKSTASCLATNNESDRNVIAIGSWNCSVTLMDLRAPTETTLLPIRHTGGITSMRFLADTNNLLTGARKDGKLILWDVRKLNDSLFTMSRNVKTNQTIYFDVSSDKSWLGSGDTDGLAHVWNLKRAQMEGKLCEFKVI